MLEDENGNREAEAMVQVREEAACTRQATMEIERRGTSRCITDSTDWTRGK